MFEKFPSWWKNILKIFCNNCFGNITDRMKIQLSSGIKNAEVQNRLFIYNRSENRKKQKKKKVTKQTDQLIFEL